MKKNSWKTLLSVLLLLAMLVSLGLAVGHFTVLPLDLTDVMQGLVLVMLVGSFAIELKFHDSMKVSQVAWGFFGALLVPYLLWVTFAGVLNFAVARLNP